MSIFVLIIVVDFIIIRGEREIFVLFFLLSVYSVVFCLGINCMGIILMYWKFKMRFSRKKGYKGKYVNICDVGSWEK